MTDHQANDNATDNPNEPSRRSMLKAGLAATGAAYIGPQILHTSIAGAQTTTCYGFKVEGGQSGLRQNRPHDPACPDAAFDNGIAAALAGGTAVFGPPPSGTVSISGINSANGSITILDPNCSIAFVGYKAGNDCFFGIGSGGISGSSSSVSISSTVHNISHITLVICCQSS